MGNEMFEEYVKDKRIACKYGYKCYQKSEQHHQKYKHPPKPVDKIQDTEDEKHVLKKRKIESSDQESEIKIYKNSDAGTSGTSTTENTESTSKEPLKESKSTELNTNSEQKINLEDMKKFIEDKFLVEMPDDFYHFWDFAKSIKPKNPLNCLSDLGLVLTGPFDVLAGKFLNTKLEPELYLIHWRYFHDPPEFQTVLKESRDKTGFHIGYFRDSPCELPFFLASNKANENGSFSIVGENIFAAVENYLAELKESGNPFERTGFRKKVSKMREDLKKFAKEKNIELSWTGLIDARQKQTVARSLNKLSVFVPYNKETQVGYRELPIDKKKLKKLLGQLRNAQGKNREHVLTELQPVFTAVNIAMDECDFGTGIEMGWDILSQDISTVNATIKQFLTAAYRSLNREGFARIIEAHMDNRRKGCQLSVLPSV